MDDSNSQTHRAKGCRLTELGATKVKQALIYAASEGRTRDSYTLDWRTIERIKDRERFVNVSSIEVLFGDLGLQMDLSYVEKHSDLAFAEAIEEVELDDEEPWGGMLPGSPYYVVRNSDKTVNAAVSRSHCIVRIEGPRQTGKTSLLARALAQARQGGALVLVTDFQSLESRDTATIESLYLALAHQFYIAAKLAVAPTVNWDSGLSANMNFQNYLREVILDSTDSPVVWGMDEVDRILDRNYANDVFSLFRSWHNRRSLNPAEAWRRLTLIMSYSTEARTLITDPRVSPFNVGTGVFLEDFTREQVNDLNTRYGGPLQTEEETNRLIALVGGNPYLVRRCLYEMKTQPKTIAEIEAECSRNGAFLADHLERITRIASSCASLLEGIRSLLNGAPIKDFETFSTLRSCGVLAGDTMNHAGFRCGLYETYLRDRLHE